MTFARDTLRDRCAGSLIGQALGDAVGFVVEGETPAACSAYVEAVLRPRAFALQRRRPGFAPFQYSDDTQLARELGTSCVERQGFDAADYAARIAAIFSDGRIVGRGLSTEAAALRLARGVPWHQAGTPPPAAGNGSAMRAGPIGLLYGHDPDRLRRVAHDQGRITHADPRCIAGAIAIAGAVAAAAHQPRLDTAALCADLAAWTAPHDPALSHAMAALPQWADAPPEDAADWLGRSGLEPAYEHTGHGDGWHGISPHVTPSVWWSLYAALHHPGDYWGAICTAVAVGGDVDTTAAMTGAIAGASVGLAGIPAEPARQVHDRGEAGHDVLITLGHALGDLHRALRGASIAAGPDRPAADGCTQDPPGTVP